MIGRKQMLNEEAVLPASFPSIPDPILSMSNHHYVSPPLNLHQLEIASSTDLASQRAGSYTGITIS